MLYIERHYAITLAQRGVDHYYDRAKEDTIYQIERLVHHGLPGLLFIRRRFDWVSAEIYVKRHPSQMHRHLMAKAREYEAFVKVFSLEQEPYIQMTPHDARKLTRFERNDDPSGGVYY